MAVNIALIALLGLFSDYLFQKLKLPGLLGMLIVGLIMGPHILNILQPELLIVSADFRMMALIVILLRAGLELRRDTLNQVAGGAISMGIIPAIFEGVVIALVAPLLLHITFLEGAILGTIVSAVSPAVVVTSMLKFIQEKRGAKKGIPTMALGASSLNDVLVIVVFTILLGMSLGNDENVLMKLLKIPESVILGIVLGGAIGYILYKQFDHFKLRATKMTIIIIAVALILTSVEELLRPYVAVSALFAVMTVGFVLLEKAEIRAHKISQKLAKFWIFAEILLFVLVGAQVDITIAWEAGLLGAVIIIIGLTARSYGTYLSLKRTDFTHEEKLFCVVSYIPKATVQAAIGAVPLEMGLPGGEIILAVSVLSIILTAPIGAIAISMAGPKWLEKEED